MIGKTLGHYRITAKLGAGGMGVVYRAQDEHLERDVAVKVLPVGTLADEDARKRFLKEALTLSKLNHPHIATVHDFDTQDGVDFLVMEYVPGETLKEKLSGGPLPEKAVTRLGLQIAEALEAAHEKGVIHRDLKPGNIVLNERGDAKVLDFGIAKLLRSKEELAEAATVDTLTKTAGMAGTLPYMSPEQLLQEEVDGRSDIYALGVVLYEMATGQRPFDEKQYTAMTDAILHQPPPLPGRLKHDLSTRLEETILKCLEKDPANRYQAAKELAVDLRRLATPTAASASRELPGGSARWITWGLGVGLGAVALLAVLIGLNLGGLREQLFGGVAPGEIRSIAVLPFENVSGDPDAEYLSDGITESLIGKLSRVPGLKVMARSTVFRYKGPDMDPLKAGQELKVGAVLTGRIQQRGETLVIGAELVNVADGTQLWGEQYSRPMSDIFAVQESIARDITRQLKLQLTPEEESALTKRGTENTEAYQLYLRGRYHWNKFTGEGLNKSIDYFLQAIEQDPGYAEAYAGLAHAYHLLGAGYGYRDLSPKEAYPRARAAVQKALEIDEALGQAHSVLGAIHFNYDWDWAGAGREFQRALELNPNYATAHLENGWYLIVLGRFDEALAEMERALELDPLSVVINSSLAVPYYFAGEYDKAIELSRKTVEMDPNFAVARLWLGWAYLEKGMHRETVVELEKAVAVLRDNTEAIGFLGYAYARSGKTDKALRVLDELQDLSEKGFVLSFARALIYVGLGEKDEAFVWLERAYEEREPIMIYLKVVPWFDPIRDDPRFQSLLRRMNFPE